MRLFARLFSFFRRFCLPPHSAERSVQLRSADPDSCGLCPGGLDCGLDGLCFFRAGVLSLLAASALARAACSSSPDVGSTDDASCRPPRYPATRTA